MTPLDIVKSCRYFLKKFGVYIPPEDYEDLIQNIHIELIRALQRYDPLKGKLHSFYFARIRGMVLDYIRSRVGEKVRFNRYTESLSHTKTACDISYIKHKEIWEEVEKRTGNKFLEYRFLREKTYQEIADIFGTTKSDISIQIKRDLQLCKESFNIRGT